MYSIDTTAPYLHHNYNSFVTALLTVEDNLHGDRSNSIEVDLLWEKICDTGEIFVADTKSGPLFITRIHTKHGTTYTPTVGEAE
ncbi:MAG: hypothetical protein GY818_13340 [Planctomycetaceae bacterium]|nr:hypothetical protein [Planctomycetaceae bacterium]